MKIDIRSEHCLYIELNDYAYYIDDSTNEQIMEKWHTYHKPAKTNKTTIEIEKETLKELAYNVNELIYWISQVNTCDESPINDYVKKADEIIESII